MSLIGYARVQTNLEGKIFRIDDLNGITEYDNNSIGQFIGDLKKIVLEEKDADLLITIDIHSEECVTYEYIEYEDCIEFPNIIVLQTKYKEKFKEIIVNLDNAISQWDEKIDFISICDLLYCETKEKAINHLHELKNEYLEGYGEVINLKN